MTLMKHINLIVDVFSSIYMYSYLCLFIIYCMNRYFDDTRFILFCNSIG